MYRTFLKPLGLVSLFALVVLVVSCQKEEATSDVDNFVTTSMCDMQEQAGLGIYGCYELVFPVSIQLPDSSTVEVNSYQEIRDAIRAWYETNGGRPHHGFRPMFVFPYQVMNAAGEIFTVESVADLAALKDLCPPRPDSTGGPGGPGGPGHGNHGDHPGDGPCFTVNFPLSLVFPDSSVVSVNNPMELAQAVHTWEKNNPGTHVRPAFQFPITVTLADGTVVTVNSPEELQAIKDACRG